MLSHSRFLLPLRSLPSSSFQQSWRPLSSSFFPFSHQPSSLLHLSATPNKPFSLNEEEQGTGRVDFGSQATVSDSRIRFSDSVSEGLDKVRLDSWLATRMGDVSRARIQASIRKGLVSVNGKSVNKVSHVIKTGDEVDCVISLPEPLKAEPENIPIDVVYEDDHVLVVNKPPHLVVHPAPGHANGTLVNGILHHCGIQIGFPVSDSSNTEDLSDDEIDEFPVDSNTSTSDDCDASVSTIRPGIVHRLDKGTSGLLVVAKDPYSHAHLAEQFKMHTTSRLYISLISGVPVPSSGRVEIPIARDPNNRIRMIAVSGSKHGGKARFAASRYRVIEVLAFGCSALVEWRLETGRTHQIRAHAKYLGNPLLGDEVYGGTDNMVLSRLRPQVHSSNRAQISQVLASIQRPCLHALFLGFQHPHTGKQLKFSCPPPHDFSEVLRQLREVSSM